jgi:hypothetical protein
LAAQWPLERYLIRIRFNRISVKDNFSINFKLSEKLFKENANELGNGTRGANSFKRDRDKSTVWQHILQRKCGDVRSKMGEREIESKLPLQRGEREGKALIIESTLNQFNVIFYSESKSSGIGLASIWPFVRVGSALCLQPNQLLFTRFLLSNVVELYFPPKKAQD